MKVFELLSACKTNMRNLTFAASMPSLSNEDTSVEVFRAVFSAIKKVNVLFRGFGFAHKHIRSPPYMHGRR